MVRDFPYKGSENTFYSFQDYLIYKNLFEFSIIHSFPLGACRNTQPPVVLGYLQISPRLTIVDSEASMSVVFFGTLNMRGSPTGSWAQIQMENPFPKTQEDSDHITEKLRYRCILSGHRQARIKRRHHPHAFPPGYNQSDFLRRHRAGIGRKTTARFWRLV